MIFEYFYKCIINVRKQLILIFIIRKKTNKRARDIVDVFGKMKKRWVHGKSKRSSN